MEKNNNYIGLTIGILVSLSLIYLTIFVGYCKNVVGDMIILIIAMQCLVYCSIELVKELLNQD